MNLKYEAELKYETELNKTNQHQLLQTGSNFGDHEPRPTTSKIFDCHTHYAAWK